jgi:nicotinamide mononucleotide (NMN) deamidase PncC
VGVVWLAAAVRTSVLTHRIFVPGEREEVRRRSAQAALDLLRRHLIRETGGD